MGGGSRRVAGGSRGGAGGLGRVAGGRKRVMVGVNGCGGCKRVWWVENGWWWVDTRRWGSKTGGGGSKMGPGGLNESQKWLKKKRKTHLGPKGRASRVLWALCSLAPSGTSSYLMT